MVQLTSNGLGGVAIFWRKSWTHVSSVSLSPHLLLVNLHNDDGQLMFVIGAQLRHKPGKREAQYAQLRKARPHLPLAPHVVILSDHNSIISPGVDSEKPTVHHDLPDLPAVAAATAQRTHRECRARIGNAVHVVRTQCNLLYVRNYLNPSFGLFSLVGCSITECFMLLVHRGCGTFELPPMFTHFQPF